MSIVTLLADFPNYSARKVRRLAKQISFITSMQNEIGPVEPAIVRGIEQDLIEFNLLQAKTEEQLNDDLVHPTTEAIAAQVMKPVVKPFIWWDKETPLPDTLEEAHEWITSMLDEWKQVAQNMGYQDFTDPEVIIDRAKAAKPAHPDEVVSRICVTPVEAARKAVNIVFDWVNQMSGPAPSSATPTFAEIRDKCNGHINGQSFYTDKRIIQARLSPQDQLPLEDPQGPAV